MKTKVFSSITQTLASIVIVTALISGCAAQGTVTQTQTARNPADSAGRTAGETHPGLLDPSKATETAPEKFRVKFQTSKGDFTVDVTRAWAPNGADRFYNMVRIGYFKDIAIFRAVENFMFQFGIHGDPAVAGEWSESNIKDDPSAGKSNVLGALSFAQTGLPNSRSVQIFVNLGNNSFLDQPRGGLPFVPFGEVVEGLDVVKKINTEYGENPRGEDIQGNFKRQGNPYILKRFPNIDIIRSVTFVE